MPSHDDFTATAPSALDTIFYRDVSDSGTGLTDGLDVCTFAQIGTELNTRYGSVSVKDYGVIGDGVTDDTVNLQAALTAAKRLHIPEGTYKITDELTITSSVEVFCDPGVIINGSTIAASASLGEKYLLRISGSLGSTLDLTGDTLEGETTITVSAEDRNLLSVGDYLLVNSAAYYSSGVSSGTNKMGWITSVKSIDAGLDETDFSTTGSAFAALLTADSAKVRKILPVTVKWHGGSFLGGGTDAGHGGIILSYGVGCLIEGVTIDGCENIGVNFTTCYGSHARGVTVRNATSTASLGNTGYGFAALIGSVGCSCSHSTFESCRHSVTGGGVLPTWFISIHNNHSTNCGLGTEDYDCHEPCFYWSFDRNVSIGGQGTAPNCKGGFVIRGKHISITNNVVRNAAGKGILVQGFITDTNGVNDYVISGNTIESAGSYGIALVTTTEAIVSEATITNNTIRDTTLSGIYSTKSNDVIIEGNRVNGVSDASDGCGIRVYSDAVANCKNVNIRGNYLEACTEGGIEIENSQQVTISDNCINTTSKPIVITTSNGVNITGNVAHQVDSANFILCSGNNIIIANCMATIAATGESYDFIRAAGSTNTHLTVIGCQGFGAYRHGVHTTSYDSIIVTGCDVAAAENATEINLDSASTTVQDHNLT